MSEKVVTYVHDGKEVYLTGRIAKPNKLSKNKDVMVEICPSKAPKDDDSYHKWVNIYDLLIIQDMNGEDFDDETE